MMTIESGKDIFVLFTRRIWYRDTTPENCASLNSNPCDLSIKTISKYRFDTFKEGVGTKFPYPLFSTVVECRRATVKQFAHTYSTCGKKMKTL